MLIASNLTHVFSGSVRTWSLKIYWKWVWSRDPEILKITWRLISYSLSFLFPRTCSSLYICSLVRPYHACMHAVSVSLSTPSSRQSKVMLTLERKFLTLWPPLLPYGYSYMPDWVKPPFVIFDIRALWRSALGARVSGCQKLQMTA